MNNYINNTPSPSFKSRNISIRKADEICRNVRKEFPVLSNSKLDCFESAKKNPECKNFVDCVSTLISNLRTYYSPDNNYVNTFRALAGMKKMRVGNCYEQALATSTALELNGYKNAQTYYLYAFNKEKNKIKDLDHIVSGININQPKDYKYWDGVETIKPEHLITPNKEGIILDSWSGFADFSNNAFTKYKNEAYFSKNLEPGDKIVLIPQQKLDFSGSEIKHLTAEYPNLLTHENKDKAKNAYSFSFFQVTEYPDENIQNVKKSYDLINTRPKVEEKQTNKFNEFIKKAKTAFTEKIINFLFMG